MKTIKFSHAYHKLHDANGDLITEAVLMGVFPIDLSDQCTEFIAWDTGHGTYSLPAKGKYLMLLFQKLGPGTTNCHLFTTLRRCTPEKLMYYEDLRGQIMRVDITKWEET